MERNFLESYAFAADVQDLGSYAMPMADSMASKAKFYYKIKRCMVCDVSRENAFVFPFPRQPSADSILLAGNVIHPEKSFPNSPKLKVTIVDHLVEITESDKVTVALWALDCNKNWYRLNKPYSTLYAAVEADFTQKINCFVSNEKNESLVERGFILNSDNVRVGIEDLCRAMPIAQPFFLEGVGIIDASPTGTVKANVRVNITQCELYISKSRSTKVSRDFRVRSGDDGTWYRMVSPVLPASDSRSSSSSSSSDLVADDGRALLLDSIYGNLFMQYGKVLGDPYLTVTDFCLTSLVDGKTMAWEDLGSEAFPKGGELTGFVIPIQTYEKCPRMRIRVEVEASFVEIDQYKKRVVAHVFVKSAVENLWYRLYQPSTLYEHFPSSLVEYLTQYDWPSEPEEEWRRLSHCKVINKNGQLTSATEITEKSTLQPFLALGRLIPPVGSTVVKPLNIRLYPFRYSIDFGSSLGDENAGLWFQMKGGAWYKALMPADAEYQAIAEADHRNISDAIRFYDALLRLDESICFYDDVKNKYYTEFSLDEVQQKSDDYFDANVLRQMPDFILNNLDHVVDFKRSKALKRSLFEVIPVDGGGRPTMPGAFPHAELTPRPVSSMPPSLVSSSSVSSSSSPSPAIPAGSKEGVGNGLDAPQSVAPVDDDSDENEMEIVGKKRRDNTDDRVAVDDLLAADEGSAAAKGAKAPQPAGQRRSPLLAKVAKSMKSGDKTETKPSKTSKKNGLSPASLSVPDGKESVMPGHPPESPDSPATQNGSKRKASEVRVHIDPASSSTQPASSASKSKPIGKRLRTSDSHLPVIGKIDYVSRRLDDNGDRSLLRARLGPTAVTETSPSVSPRMSQSTPWSSAGTSSSQAPSSSFSAGGPPKAAADQPPTIVGREQVHELFRKKNRVGAGSAEADPHDPSMQQLLYAKHRRAEEEQAVMQHWLSRGYGKQTHPSLGSGRAAPPWNSSLEDDRLHRRPPRARSPLEENVEAASHRPDPQRIFVRSSRWATTPRFTPMGELYASVDSSEMDRAYGDTSDVHPSDLSSHGGADDRPAPSGYTCCHCASKKKMASCPNPLHLDGMLCANLAASKATAASLSADRSQSAVAPNPGDAHGARTMQSTPPLAVPSRVDLAVHQPLSLVSHYNSSFASILPPTRARPGLFIQSPGVGRKEGGGGEDERRLCSHCKSLRKSPTCVTPRHRDECYFSEHILVEEVDPLAHGLCPHCRGKHKRESCPFAQHMHGSLISRIESAMKNGHTPASVVAWPLTAAAERHAASTFVYEGCEEDALLSQVAANSLGATAGVSLVAASELEGSDAGGEDDAGGGKLSRKVAGDERKERQRYLLSKWSSAKRAAVATTASSEAVQPRDTKPGEHVVVHSYAPQVIAVGQRERDPAVLFQRRTMQSLGVYAEQTNLSTVPASTPCAPPRSAIKQSLTEKKKSVQWADLVNSAGVQFREVREYDPSHTIVDPQEEL